MIIKQWQRLHPNRRNYVNPRISDINISNISEQTIEAREYKSSQFGGGRFGGAWFSIATFIFVFLLFIIPMIFSKQNRLEKLQDWEIYLFSVIAMLVAFCPFFIIWRRELPVCFNRNTRKVSFWTNEQLYQVDWDKIEAYVKLVSTSKTKEQILTFEVFSTTTYSKTLIKHNINILGTDYWEKDDPAAGVKALWEYFYLFMEKGKQAVSHVKIETGGLTFIESLKENNPFPHKDLDWLGVIIHIVLLPLTIPLYFITVPTDVIYTYLDDLLPKRSLPKQLLDARNAVK